jgi:hypothetical protein
MVRNPPEAYSLVIHKIRFPSKPRAILLVLAIVIGKSIKFIDVFLVTRVGCFINGSTVKPKNKFQFAVVSLTEDIGLTSGSKSCDRFSKLETDSIVDLW